MESEQGHDVEHISQRSRREYPDQERAALLTPSSRGRFDYGVLRNCVIPVNKSVASLTFDLITELRKSMGAVRYKIGHAGIVDVMGSGLVLLLCGYATQHMWRLSHQEKEYIGRFRIGQETKTFDVLSPVQMTHPWRHISNEDMTSQTKNLIGGRLRLHPADYIPKITNKNVLCHLKRRNDSEKTPKLMQLTKFDVSRSSPNSNEFEFHVICKSTLSVNCLIHELGQRLRCGAHVLHSERIRIGDLTLSEHSWDPQDLREYITQLRQTAYLKNYKLYDEIKNQYWRRLGPASNRKRRKIRKRRQLQAKIKKQIKEGKREPIMTQLCY